MLRRAAILIVAIWASPLFAQPQTNPIPQLTPRELARNQAPTDLKLAATHQIAFPGTEFIQATGLSPDGRRTYCLVDGRAIELWSLLVSWWPEILGAVTGLVLTIWAGIFASVRRRPQTPGAPHCRKCNYNVIGQVPAESAPAGANPAPRLCPECGVDLAKKRPRTGRSFRRRLWLPTTIMVLVALGYGAMQIAALPRSGRASGWFMLTSRWLDAYAEKHAIGWLQKRSGKFFRIAIVDTQAGQEIGTLCHMRSYPVGGMKVSPDGRHIALGDQQGRVSWISTSSGRTSASLSTGGSFQSGYRTEFLIGFTGPTADPWVYIAYALSNADRSRLCRWRPSTGEQQLVVDEPAYVRSSPGTVPGAGVSAPETRRYALLKWSALDAHTDLPAVASAPDFSQAYNDKNYPIVVRDAAGQILRTIPVDEKFVCTSPMLVTPDGGRVFLSGAHEGLFGFDLRTGERLGTLKAGMFDNFDDNIAISRDGRRLFLSCGHGSILVRDIDARKWIARLEYPSAFIGPSLSISPDGRWLAATPFRSSTGVPSPTTKYTHELFLFDLAPLDNPPPPPSPAATPQHPQP